MRPSVVLVGDDDGQIFKVDFASRERKGLWKRMAAPIVNIVVVDWTVAVMTTRCIEVFDFGTNKSLFKVDVEDLGTATYFAAKTIDEDAIVMPEAMTLSAGADILAFACVFEVFAFNLTDCTLITSFVVESDAITSLEFSSDEEMLLVSGICVCPQLWNVKDGTFMSSYGMKSAYQANKVQMTNCPSLLEGFPVVVSKAIFYKGDKTIMYSIQNLNMMETQLIVADVATGAIHHWSKQTTSQGGFIDLSPMGKWAISCDGDEGYVAGYDLTDLRLPGEIGQEPVTVQPEAGTEIFQAFGTFAVPIHVHNEDVTSELYFAYNPDHPCTCGEATIDEPCVMNGLLGDILCQKFYPDTDALETSVLAVADTSRLLTMWHMTKKGIHMICEQRYDSRITSIAFVNDAHLQPERIAAFCMSHIPRLGAEAPCNKIEADIIRHFIFKTTN
jgi:WD40 repeat protein